MSNPNHQIGGVVNAVKRSVQQFGISPHSPVVVRVGDHGTPMPIEHVKVSGGLNPHLILQVREPE